MNFIKNHFATISKLVLLISVIIPFHSHTMVNWLVGKPDPDAWARTGQALVRSVKNEVSAGEVASGLNSVIGQVVQGLDQQVQSGDIDRAFGNTVNMIGRRFQQGGEADGVAQEGVGFLRRTINQFGSEFSEGSEADRAAQEGANFITRNVNNLARQLGNELNNEAGELNNLAEEGIGFLHKNMNQVSSELRDELKEGGTIHQTLGEARRLFDTHITSLYNHAIFKASFTPAYAALLVIGGFYGIRFAWREIERAWVRPKLIIKYRKNNFYNRLKGFIFPSVAWKPSTMIFAPKLEEQLNDTLIATKNIYKKINAGAKSIYYNNILLYGPPGTGKTMFAEQLAHQSGMDFAVMSGSSFSKFKKGQDIEAMDELFKWANNSKGLLIFIDEAESFLGKRENIKPDSQSYQLLNNFLNYTGTRSNKFMFVFATNHKDAPDSAMTRRIHEAVFVDLPGYPERVKVLNLYREKVLLDSRQNGQQFVDSVRNCLTEAKINHIAELTKCFSNSDLENLILAIKTYADITGTGLVTNQVIDKAVERAMAKHQNLAQQVRVATA